MINGLYLCGTVHLDLVGPKRLRKILETIAPDYVAIESYPEISEEVLKRRKEYENIDGETLLQKIRDNSPIPTEGIRVETARALSSCVGYEVWVPYEYAKKTGAQIVHIEDKERADRLTQNFLESILEDPKKAEPFIEMLRQSPRKLKSIMDFVYEICPINKKDETETVERNEVFAQRIQGLDGRVVAVVGLGHVYGIEPTMKTLLKKYKPKDIKLIEADYFDS